MAVRKHPVFAVLGHPNEGKSSVVSTLAEDDSVRISPTPGETRACRAYPVIIDGQEVVKFVDTPGFQRPRDTLKWMEAYTGPDEQMIGEFIRAHAGDAQFADEVELLTPLADGAGIIFVVDGSRPVRATDRMEMEILRKTGLPRMVVINTKDSASSEFIEEWKAESRKHFNIIRIFDAHRASFAERIDLLESLKGIDPDWEQAFRDAIAAFRSDWNQRIAETSQILTELLESVLQHTNSKRIRDISRTDEVRQQLIASYQKDIAKLEKRAQERIRTRFKHNIFSYELPPQSIVRTDLFDLKTWQALGLTRQQMAWAGAGIGSVIGAKIDLALGGLTFGVFTALGGILGAGSAAFGTKQLAQSKIKGQALGGVRIQVGPVQNDQLLYVLIDRTLIYFSYVINWAHSRRDRAAKEAFGNIDISRHLTARWTEESKKICRRFFSAVRRSDSTDMVPASAAFRERIAMVLSDLSNFNP